MWGRVNIVGHDEAQIDQKNLYGNKLEFNNKSSPKFKEDKEQKKEIVLMV